MSTAAQPFCRHVGDYSALVEAVRDRSDQLLVSRLELDRLAGLPDGFAGKILSTKPVKQMGMKTLGPVLETLGLIILLVENPAARDRTLSRRIPFQAHNRRPENHSNPRKGANILPAPEPVECVPSATIPQPRGPEPAMRSHLHVVQPRHKGARFGGML